MLSQRIIRANRIDESQNTGNADIPPYPTYTNYPTVDYATLWAAAPNSEVMNDGSTQTKGPLSGAGSNVGIVLRSMSSRAYVVLPAPTGGVSWWGELVGASDVNNYSVYAPNCMGIWCHPTDVPDVTFDASGHINISNGPMIKQKEGSATGDQSTTGKNGGNAFQTAMRIGPYGGAETGPIYMYGWTLVGSDQDIDPSTGLLRATAGIIDYYSTNSVWQIVKAKGFIATWNAPPGETFQISSFRTHGCKYEFIETDGFNENGDRRGGAFGFFAVNDIEFTDCYFHDSKNSGWTGGISGDVQTGTSSVNMTATRVYSWNNANYTASQGQGFSCFNAEGVIGTALLDHCNFKPTWPKMGGATNYNNLIDFFSLVDDCQITIIEPEWNPGTYGSSINNAFGFDMSASYAQGRTNTQVTPPTVIKNGVTLQPVHVQSGATYDPSTQYAYLK